MQQTQAASLTLAANQQGDVVDAAQVEKLVSILVIVVPEENTAAGRAETKGILEQAFDYIKSIPGGLVGDAFKETVKVTVVGAPMLALAQFLKRRAKETGNKSIAWTGEAAEKIAELFGKHPASGAITTEQLHTVFGDKALAAETLLLMLGYTRHGNEWRRAG